MPTVLHVLPADATLSCPGLADWLKAGPGFASVFVGDDPAIRTKIREGNISSLKQELEAQKILIEQGRSPLLSSDERRR